MDDLPFDVIYEIALHLPSTDLVNLCSVKSNIHEALCGSGPLWAARLRSDYGITDLSNIDSYRRHYINLYYGRWYIMGRIGGAGAMNETRVIEIPGEQYQKEMSVCKRTILITTSLGQVWGMGVNIARSLQDSNNTVIRRPTPVDGTEGLDIVKASTGCLYTYILDEWGLLWARGSNNLSQLGVALPNSLVADQFVLSRGQVGNMVSMKCTPEFTVAIDNDGDVWGVGDNSAGQFGDIGVQLTEFTKISLPFKVAGFDCGKDYIMYIDTEGNLWGSGYNRSSRMGLPHSFNYTTPIRISKNNRVRQVSCGLERSAIVDQNNTLWLSNNTDGKYKKVGNGGAAKAVVEDDVVLVLSTDGTVWGYGPLINRILGLPDTTGAFTQIPGVIASDIECGTDAIMFKRRVPPRY